MCRHPFIEPSNLPKSQVSGPFRVLPLTTLSLLRRVRYQIFKRTTRWVLLYKRLLLPSQNLHAYFSTRSVCCQQLSGIIFHSRCRGVRQGFIQVPLGLPNVVGHENHLCITSNPHSETQFLIGCVQVLHYGGGCFLLFSHRGVKIPQASKLVKRRF